MTKKTILECKNLHKSYVQGKNKIHILDDANLNIYEDEFIALVGPSGSGKTTLLQILGLLDKPDTGHLMLEGFDYSKRSDRARTMARKSKIGFVYQNYNLLSDFTAIENVMFPLLLNGAKKSTAHKQASALLGSFGLNARLNHLPAELSGGEQQRVAIARSFIHDPLIILADEPTGNLDEENAKKILEILVSKVREFNKTLFVVTHNLNVAKLADRRIQIKHGKIINA